MKKYLSIRTCLLFLILLIILGGMAYHRPEAVFPKKALADAREIDRLFQDMGILKVPHTTQPIEIRLPDVTGKTAALSQFRGKIVFLNFWTTWCPACITEMPSMQRLHSRFNDKSFAMVAINLREPAERVKQFFKEYKLTFLSLLDQTGDVGLEFTIRSIPTTFILDGTGKIVGKALGAREWDGTKSIALFEQLIVANAGGPS